MKTIVITLTKFNMPNLNDIPQQQNRPFIDNGITQGRTLNESNRITGFKVTHKGKDTLFNVNRKTWDVQEAFVKFKKFIDKLI